MKMKFQHPGNHTKSAWIGLLFFCALPLFQSCSSGEDELVQKSEKAAREMLQDLPQLKEEIDEHKAKVNSQTLTGSFSGEIDGESFDFSDWKASNSRVSFLDFKAKIYATMSQKPFEGIEIELVKNNWSEMEFPADIAASIYAIENGEYLSVRYSKKDNNGDVLSQFQSAEGTMTIHQFGTEKVRISFDGEGFVGDIRKQERAPLKFEIDLDYNFASSDARTVQ